MYFIGTHNWSKGSRPRQARSLKCLTPRPPVGHAQENQLAICRVYNSAFGAHSHPRRCAVRSIFASSVKWQRDPIGNWNVDFVPTDTAKYAYEIQVAGKGDKNSLACTKFAASYRTKLNVKDVNGEIGISSQKAFDAKISGHADSVDVFGGFYNRIPTPWYQRPVEAEVHLRVAVYEKGQLVYTTD